MKNKILIILYLVSLFILGGNPVYANVIFPHLMLIHVYSVVFFAVLIIGVEVFVYKKLYKNISLLFLIISTFFVNAVSSFAGIFYGAFTNGDLGYSANIIFIITNFFICCLLSWIIEYVFLYLIFHIAHKTVPKLYKSVFLANLLSYLVIFILYVMLFYLPVTHEKLFYGFRSY